MGSSIRGAVVPAPLFSTIFPVAENPISQGGIWLNGALDGGGWANCRVLAPGKVIGLQSGADFTDGTALLSTINTSNDLYCEGVVFDELAGASTGFPEVENRLCSLLSSGSNTGYEANYSMNQGASGYASIVRWNGGVGAFDELIRGDGAQFNVTHGDIIAFRKVGQTFISYKNGAEMLRFTDNSVSKFTTGMPGIGFNRSPSGGGADNTKYGFSRWTVVAG